MTTTHFDHYEIGATAVGVLMRRLQSPRNRSEPDAIELDTELVVRGSTAPPPQAPAPTRRRT